MAIYRYGFDIHRPNPAIALGAASLGETMRSNRAAEAQRDAAAQAAAAKVQEERTRYGAEQARLFEQDLAGHLNRVATIEDPQAQQAAWAQSMSSLARAHPARNGVNPLADISPTWDPNLANAFREAGKPGSTAQKIADLEAAGFSREQIANAVGATQDMAGVTFPAPVVRELADGSTVALSIDPRTLETRRTVIEEAPDAAAAAAAEAEAAAQQTEATERARTEARESVGQERLRDIWTQYKDAVDKAPRAAGFVKDPNARKNLEGLRRRLYTAIAKTVLGTPGAEPSPELYRRADEMVPGWEGTALIGFEGAMNSLLDQQGGGGDGDSTNYADMSTEQLEGVNLDSLNEDQLKAWMQEAQKR